jgi:hypothetical protein
MNPRASASKPNTAKYKRIARRAAKLWLSASQERELPRIGLAPQSAQAADLRSAATEGARKRSVRADSASNMISRTIWRAGLIDLISPAV